MNLLRAVRTGCLVMGLIALGAVAVRADDKDVNKTKIVGTWEMVKTTAKDSPPPGTLVEFTKDGKFKLLVKAADKEIKLDGTYSVDGDKLKTAMKGPDGKEVSDTDTITKLDDKEMTLKGSKGEITEFKKKK
jgi:uncharacterized protein (TIGR03066 family)